MRKYKFYKNLKIKPMLTSRKVTLTKNIKSQEIKQNYTAKKIVSTIIKKIKIKMRHSFLQITLET